MNKAVKVLPNYTIVHRQDWFLKENYRADTHKDGDELSDRSFRAAFQ